MSTCTETVAEALRRLRARLRAARVPESGPKAEWTLAHALGCGRLDLLARAAEPLPGRVAVRLNRMVERLCRHEPLQYVLGNAEFRGRVFACDARALIPRPETEELVGRALDLTELWARPAPRVADAGTGCGVIAITLALERPQARVIATDVSVDALALARTNARRHGVEDRIVWRRGDWLEGVAAGSLDAVVSNPPYVPSRRVRRLARQVRAYEPRLALDGGPDGLAAIRRLIAHAGAALAPAGWLLMEIGEDQGNAVAAMLHMAGFAAVAIHHDLAGHDRFAVARRR